MAAPTFVSEAESTWDVLSSAITTPAFATELADVLVALASNEGNTAEAISNSGAALTWTTQQDVSAANFSRALAATATGRADAAFSVTTTSTTGHHGVNALTFRNSGGVGATAKANTTGAPSLAITTQQANSAIAVLVADWNATDGASRAWRAVNGITPSSSNGFELTYFTNPSLYTVYVAYYPDAGAAGVKTVGLTALTGQKYSIVAVEIKGTAGGTDASVTAPALAGTGAFANPSIAAGATVTPPPLSGAGSLPAPSATGTGTAQVLAAVAAGTGSFPAPSATGTSSAQVVAPPLAGVGTFPMGSALSSGVQVGPLAGTGTFATPSVSGSVAGNVQAVPMAGSGSLLAPAVTGTAAGTVDAPAATGAGDINVPSLAAGATVQPPPLAGAGSLPAPTATGGTSQTVAAAPAEGVGDLAAPTVAGTASATVDAPAADGTGSLPTPGVSDGTKVTPDVVTPAGLTLDPHVREVVLDAHTNAVALDAHANAVALDAHAGTVTLDGHSSTITLDA